MTALKQNTEIVPLNLKSGPSNILTILIHKPWPFYQVSPEAQAIIYDQDQTKCGSILTAPWNQSRHSKGHMSLGCGLLEGLVLLSHSNILENPVCIYFSSRINMFSEKQGMTK